MHIFVDDIRQPEDWVWAKTVAEAQKLIDQCTSFTLSLDHDLGGDETTRSLINWLLMTGRRPDAAAVHSSNPVGRQWLEVALDRDFGEPVPRCAVPKWH